MKVQHRWIKEQVPGDMRLTVAGSNFAKYLFGADFKFEWVAEEFEQRLPLELDFTKEAQNCKKSKHYFEKHANICIPKVYEEFTRPRVLVMSFE